MYPLNTRPPRADGADGIIPRLSLTLGGTTHRSRRPAIRPYPPASVQGLHLWYETMFRARVLHPLRPCTPANTIMLPDNAQDRVLDWIEAACKSKVAHLRGSFDNPPASIDGFPRQDLLLALEKILLDEYHRSEKIALHPDADLIPWRRQPDDPITPLFKPCLGKVTVDEHVGGVYDLVQEMNTFNP
ncbi:hypothetical protein C8T65DRAFT_832164 [Cerioporus squamosus]|nr:hypothetical protein C8T65DRAFT_832164 [Cerioporus squamosus]